MQEKERLSSKPDLFETVLAHYASLDLISSGMPRPELDKVRSPALPLKERWELVAPFWERIQNTGYTWALRIAFRDLYGIPELSNNTHEFG